MNITEMSLMPAILLLAAAVFSAYLNEHRDEGVQFNTGFIRSDLTDDEWRELDACESKVFRLSLPLYLPFIFFFPSWVKLFSLLVFFGSFAGGAVYFRIRFGKDVKARRLREAEELEAQKKRESSGR